MRRRARETFVLGAERVFEEAELDLRNKAETDHEPESELDHTAPVEPSIDPAPAGPPVGAGTARAEPSGSSRRFRRPRPPVGALALGGAVAAALVGVAFRGDDRIPSIGQGAGHGVAQAVSESKGATAREPARHTPTSRRPADTAGAQDRTRTDDRDAHPGQTEDAARGLTSASPRPGIPAPAPTEVASTVPPSTPAFSPQSAPPSEPVQSAAAVRREFGP